MVSTRRKGNEAELRCEKEMQSDGWLTYRVKGSTRFNRNVDIFGLFDLVCVFPCTGGKPPRRKWIQVKNNKRVYGKALIPFLDFRRDYCDDNDSVEIWTWRGRKGWEIRTLKTL